LPRKKGPPITLRKRRKKNAPAFYAFEKRSSYFNSVISGRRHYYRGEGGGGKRSPIFRYRVGKGTSSRPPQEERNLDCFAVSISERERGKRESGKNDLPPGIKGKKKEKSSRSHFNL